MEMGIKWVTTIYNSQAKTKSNRIKVHAFMQVEVVKFKTILNIEVVVTGNLMRVA